MPKPSNGSFCIRYFEKKYGDAKTAEVFANGPHVPSVLISSGDLYTLENTHAKYPRQELGGKENKETIEEENERLE